MKIYTIKLIGVNEYLVHYKTFLSKPKKRKIIVDKTGSFEFFHYVDNGRFVEMEITTLLDYMRANSVEHLNSSTIFY